MDVAALALNIDSAPVRRATKDLDSFSASADKAASSASKLSGGGSISKMVQDYSRASQAANQASGSISRIADAVVRSNAAMVAANDNVGRSFAQANAHVLAYQKQLAAVPAAANQAANGLARVTTAANDNASAFQNNAANIAAQVQDVGVTAAMGMNPLLIALQQGTQLSAVFAASGSSAFSTLGAAIKQVISPTALFTIAIVALISYIIQLGMEMFKTSDDTTKLSDAFDTAAFSTYALNDAQGILGNVFDLTTGKIINQTGALHDLARAQLLAAQAQSMGRLAEHNAYLNQVGQETGQGRGWYRDSSGRWMYGQAGQTFEALLAQGVQTGTTSTQNAMDMLAGMQRRGAMNNETFNKMLGAVSGLGVEKLNQQVFEEALKSLETGQLGERFMNESSSRSRSRSGGKSDADRWAEIVRTAKEATVAEENRSKAVKLTAMETAELEQRTRLLNAASSAGLKVTPALAVEIDKLSKSYASAKVNADAAEAIAKTTEEIQRQRDAIADEVKLIGLRGEAYDRARREIEADRRLRQALPKGEIYVGGNLTGGLSDDIEKANRDRRIAEIKQGAEDAAYAMDLERRGLGLTGAAALEYAFISERLIEAKRAGIELSPAEIEAINAAGAAYANQRYAIDQAAQAISDAREVTKGFFADWINGVREGGNLFKTFADSVVNSLNRIIDKLLDRTLNGFLDSMFAGGSGFLGGLFGGGSSANSFVSTGAGLGLPTWDQMLKGGWKFDPTMNALGGVYGTAQKFAKGGAFTNQIVTTPTLFKFANGGKFGEMGEAGPEAIMPLTRGPNGALGVQAHGAGGQRNAEINVHNEFKLDGAIGADSIVAMIRQASSATQTEIKRNLEAWLREWDADGAVSS